MTEAAATQPGAMLAVSCDDATLFAVLGEAAVSCWPTTKPRVRLCPAAALPLRNGWTTCCARMGDLPPAIRSYPRPIILARSKEFR